MTAVAIVHQSKRLAIYGSLSRALRHLRKYPIGALVIAVPSGSVLCERVSCQQQPPITEMIARAFASRRARRAQHDR